MTPRGSGGAAGLGHRLRHRCAVRDRGRRVHQGRRAGGGTGPDRGAVEPCRWRGRRVMSLPDFTRVRCRRAAPRNRRTCRRRAPPMRASISCRWPRPTRWRRRWRRRPVRGSPPFCAVPTPPCMRRGPGQSGNMPASRRPRNRTPSTGATLPPARWGCPWPSTCRRIAVMIPTIRLSPMMSGWPVWPSIP